MSRGKKSDPVLECWTTLTAAAHATSRMHVGSFINNVMNRHPAVLARMLATLADSPGWPGRAGHRRRRLSGPELRVVRHPVAGRRPNGSAILEEAVAVIRAAMDGRPGRLRRPLLPTARRLRASRARSAAAHHRRWREARRCPARGARRRRLDDQRRPTTKAAARSISRSLRRTDGRAPRRAPSDRRFARRGCAARPPATRRRHGHVPWGVAGAAARTSSSSLGTAAHDLPSAARGRRPRRLACRIRSSANRARAR